MTHAKRSSCSIADPDRRHARRHHCNRHACRPCPADRAPVPVGSVVAKGLPAPDPSKAATRFAKVVGWPEGTAPSTVAGFTVTLFAANLSSPRWLYVVPNGDV